MMSRAHRKIISLLLALSFSVLLIPNVYGAASGSAAAFTKEIREKMLAREEEIPFTFTVSKQELASEYDDDFDSYLDAFFDAISDGVFAHDGTLKGGDYLAKHTGTYGFSTSMSTTSSSPEWTVNAVFSASYYTTARQEKDVDEKMDKLLEELIPDGVSDYEKIRRVYDYICSHVTYDYANLNNDSYKLKYTAYAALINGTAVCQGYANLFYLFMQRLGIDCRIISGIGNGEAHAWNIVKLGNLYYLLDATWDVGAKTYRWFLKGSKDFPNHTADAEFLAEPFFSDYPISEGSFSPEHKHVPTVLIGKAPSCLEPGWTDGETCSVCGEILTAQTEIPALGHDLTAHNAKEATCTAFGWNAYQTCSRCDYTTYSEISAKGHDLVDHEAKDATCTAVGWTAYQTCSRCDYTTYAEIPAKGHDLADHEAKEATCTAVGWNAYQTCSRCDYTTYAEIPAKGHDLADHEAKEATCTAVGWNAYQTCSRCNYTTYVEIKAKGHDLSREETLLEPTETESGILRVSCSRCDYYEDREIPPTSSEPEILPGDVNGDGKVTAADARLALRRAVGLENYAAGSPKFLACDVNGDGKVNAADARRILRAAVGLETLR